MCIRDRTKASGLLLKRLENFCWLFRRVFSIFLSLLISTTTPRVPTISPFLYFGLPYIIIGRVVPSLFIAVYLSLIHISEPTRLGMISYAVFCLKKKKNKRRMILSNKNLI